MHLRAPLDLLNRGRRSLQSRASRLRPRRRGLQPGVETLEVREVLSLTFNFSIVDPNNQFAGYQPGISFGLETAARSLGKVLDGKGVIDVQVQPVTLSSNVLAYASVASNQLINVGSSGGVTIYQTAAEYEANTGVDPNGATPEFNFSINTNFLSQDYFDPTGALRSSTVPSNQIDFDTIATHEILHGLGFLSIAPRDTSGNLSPTRTYESQFDAFTASTGGYAYFIGPQAEAAYGNRAVPLYNDGTTAQGSNFSHIGNPSPKPGSDLVPDLMYASVSYGSRKFISTVDAGIMYDIGFAHSTRPNPAAINDFDGDGKSDIAVFDKSTANWYIRESTRGPVGPIQYGGANWVPVPGDYDGDGKTDLAVFEPGGANWYHINSSTGQGVGPAQFGGSNWIPVQGDYDGDGKTDLAVVDPASSTWYVQKTTGGGIVQQFGGVGWNYVPGDYDGDGKTDLAVQDPSTSTFYIQNSGGAPSNVIQFGGANWLPVPGDYDGDGRTDVAVVDPSNFNWYTRNSSNGQGNGPIQFGATTWIPIDLPNYLRKKKVTG